MKKLLALVMWVVLSPSLKAQNVSLPAVYLYQFNTARTSAVGFSATVGQQGFGAFIANPALGGLLENRAFSVVYADYGLFQQMVMGGIYWPHIKESPFSMAAGWTLLRVGEIDGRDELGNQTENFSISHHVGAVTITYGGFSPEDDEYSSFSIGLTIKGLWNNYYYIHGTGFLADAGLLWGIPRDDYEGFPYTFQIGIMVTEIGGQIRWSSGIKDQIQPRVHSAILWAPKEWIYIVSEVSRWPSGEILFGGGSEFVLWNHIILRAGWHNTYGVTFGLGLQWGETKQFQMSAAQLVSPLYEGNPRIWEMDLEY